ncbi:MAG: glycerol-3-phosphate 1-O-acyltransferase PlsY [Bacteroides sp.]|nr:glycerol-3-phosphate 1-O-acyltransferase PlsY [Eubacterium sp.]MCM1418013.1 glycerol-3-phosphate 1-O-acyltransferase PlsY [Roseburia sp.]MCM1462164.1 glycerol-3-phosphate 1-O-acyltransferase PlsY [Bacteroides sp.]
MELFLKILCFAAVAVIPYLLCGVNSAIIVTRLKTGKDIRSMGSGNAGLTNTLRTQGKLAALFVLVGDILKGVLSILAVSLLFRLLLGVDTYSMTEGFSWVNYCAGVFAVLGHIYPVFYGFKGGKGILVTFAIMLTIDAVPALLLLGVFGIVTALTRYVSLGSIVAAALYPFTVLAFSLMEGNVCAWADFAFAAGIAFLLIFMHRANLKRLKDHTEKKLGEKAS